MIFCDPSACFHSFKANFENVARAPFETNQKNWTPSGNLKGKYHENLMSFQNPKMFV